MAMHVCLQVPIRGQYREAIPLQAAKLKDGEDTCNEISARRDLEMEYPTYFHCNKNLRPNCFVMLLRQMKFKLKDWEDLYDQFDH